MLSLHHNRTVAKTQSHHPFQIHADFPLSELCQVASHQEPCPRTLQPSLLSRSIHCLVPNAVISSMVMTAACWVKPVTINVYRWSREYRDTVWENMHTYIHDFTMHPLTASPKCLTCSPCWGTTMWVTSHRQLDQEAPCLASVGEKVILSHHILPVSVKSPCVQVT